MNQLPNAILAIRERANIAADAHREAWDVLQGIAVPTLRDLDQWLEARKTFYVAQEAFETAIRQVVTSPNPG
jgi:hypothetical protein